MQLSLRFFGSLTVLVLLLGVLALLVPETPGLGAPPSVSAVLELLQTPLILVPAGLAVLAVVWVKTRPLPQAMARAAQFLPPVGGDLSATERQQAVRRSFSAHAKAADGLLLADLLVHAAVQSGASDIHVHPGANAAELSLRVDGALSPLMTIDTARYAALLNRLKVLGRLTHYVHDRPQDGGFSLPTPDGVAEVRISLLPTQHGEKAVLRLSGLANELPQLDALRLQDSVRAQLTRMLEKPQGLIFFTGPTGSGKTTSIYASVAHVQASRGALAQVATIEEPIEHSIPGAAQTQVNRAAGLDFASGLRSLLRQDPNVIVVGEIRDVETARIATQAALTGHLILTTVHADSAPGVFSRLLEMGVEASVLASVSLACFSQRLVRRLCPHCRTPSPPTPEQRARLEAVKAPLDGYFAAAGCEECGHTGLAGRTALFEVLVVTDELREALKGAPSTQQLMALSTDQGLVPLREGALKAARAGEISLSEALRVTD